MGIQSHYESGFDEAHSSNLNYSWLWTTWIPPPPPPAREVTPDPPRPARWREMPSDAKWTHSVLLYIYTSCSITISM